MNQSIHEHQDRYRQHFCGVRPILEKHFPGVDEQRIPEIVHYFIAVKETSIYEDWNYTDQQKILTSLRATLQQAAANLSKIHPVILKEVSANLTLPLEILNGTYDRKTCAEEVFNLAPSLAESSSAFQVLTDLKAFGENIDKAIKYTQDELPSGIFVGNRNIDAWRVVEAAVEVRRRFPDEMNVPKKMDVPKKMNGSGPLRRLLEELFQYYNINANVDAAFNGWLKHIDRKRDSLDLLPID